MKLPHTLSKAMLAVVMFVTAGSAGATPITGTANITGSVNVSSSAVTFMPTFSDSSGSETGAFSGLAGGTIISLTNGPDTGVTNVRDFASFTSGLGTPVYFDLTYISPGVGTAAGCSSAALGSECTLPGSPFTLFQLPSDTVVATLQLNGIFYTGSSTTGYSAGTSVFSTQTALNGTIPQIVALLNSGQTLSGITYAASFMTSSAPVPEPASVGLLAIGFLGANFCLRRKSL